jgi:hypothetical protein
MKLWEGTDYEQLSAAIESVPQLAFAYRMGVIDQTIAELLGVLPGEDNVPGAAREVGMRMMSALSTGQNILAAVMESAELIRSVRGGKPQ